MDQIDVTDFNSAVNSALTRRSSLDAWWSGLEKLARRDQKTRDQVNQIKEIYREMLNRLYQAKVILPD